MLLAAAIAGGYALIRLRRRGYAQDLSIWAVFASVYALFLSVHLPLNDVNLPKRYLAPLYVPALVAATLFLNEVLRCVAHTRPLAQPYLHLLRQWGIGATVTANWGTLILTTCMALHLLQLMSTGYNDIRLWMDNGSGHASKRWRNSSAIRYVDNHLHNMSGPLMHLAPVKRTCSVWRAGNSRHRGQHRVPPEPHA